MAAAERDAAGLLTLILADPARGNPNPAASVADVMTTLPAPEREAFGELYDQMHGLMHPARGSDGVRSLDLGGREKTAR
jgi:hypothetical protein